MTPELQKYIDLLESQLGYTEKTGAYTKFGDWYGKNVEFDADYSGAPWCDMYLSWAAHKLGYEEWIGQFAWTVAHAKWFKAQGAWGHTPKPGALVFFDWSGSRDIDKIDHVGIVTRVEGDTIYTIEGNIDGGVAKRKERDTGKVVGYGYPERIKARLDQEAAQKRADEQAAMQAKAGTGHPGRGDSLSSLIPHVETGRPALSPLAPGLPRAGSPSTATGTHASPGSSGTQASGPGTSAGQPGGTARQGDGHTWSGPGTDPTTSGKTSGTASSTTSGTASGTTPGGTSGAIPGGTSGTAPGTTSDATSGTGTGTGTRPGTATGTGTGTGTGSEAASGAGTAARKGKHAKPSTADTTAGTAEPLLSDASASSPLPAAGSPTLIGSALVAAVAVLALTKSRQRRLRTAIAGVAAAPAPSRPSTAGRPSTHRRRRRPAVTDQPQPTTRRLAVADQPQLTTGRRTLTDQPQLGTRGPAFGDQPQLTARNPQPVALPHGSAAHADVLVHTAAPGASPAMLAAPLTLDAAVTGGAAPTLLPADAAGTDRRAVRALDLSPAGTHGTPATPGSPGHPEAGAGSPGREGLEPFSRPEGLEPVGGSAALESFPGPDGLAHVADPAGLEYFPGSDGLGRVADSRGLEPFPELAPAPGSARPRRTLATRPFDPAVEPYLRPGSPGSSHPSHLVPASAVEVSGTSDVTGPTAVEVSGTSDVTGPTAVEVTGPFGAIVIPEAESPFDAFAPVPRPYRGRRRRHDQPADGRAGALTPDPRPRGRRHRSSGAHGPETFRQDAPLRGRRHRAPDAAGRPFATSTGHHRA